MLPGRQGNEYKGTAILELISRLAALFLSLVMSLEGWIYKDLRGALVAFRGAERTEHLWIGGALQVSSIKILATVLKERVGLVSVGRRSRLYGY